MQWESLPYRSSALFLMKNCFSAFLMSRLAAQQRHKKQIALGNVYVEDDYAKVIFGTLEKQYFKRVHRKQNLWFQWEQKVFSWDAKRKPIYVYHTKSYTLNGLLQGGKNFPAYYSLVVEHSLVESFRYIEACHQGKTEPNTTYLLIFYDEVMKFLQRHHIETTIDALPFPDFPKWSAPISKNAQEQSLFAITPVVDDAVISEEDCRKSIEAFLGRRSADWTYIIKPHPRPCEKTVALLTNVFDRAGVRYQILENDYRMLETAWPDLDCSELSCFYSSSGPFTNRLYGVPCDSMLGEFLSDATILKEHHLFICEMMAQMFDVPYQLSVPNQERSRLRETGYAATGA